MSRSVDRSTTVTLSLFRTSSALLVAAIAVFAGQAVWAAPADDGEWGPVIAWPEIAISGANLPDGRVLTWSSTETNAFPSNREFAHASVFDPATGTFITVDNNFHDTFCAGISTLEDGTVVASGGNPDDDRTSSFSPDTLSWSALANMHDRRWYGTNITLPNNEIFSTFGKSAGNRSEVYNPETNTWRRTPNATMQTLVDEQNFINGQGSPANTSGLEWWAHLAVTPEGRVFQGGPTPTWHVFDPLGGADNQSLDRPIGDLARMYGNVTSYDEGKLILIGGYDRRRNPPVLSTNVLLVDLNGAAPAIASGAPMNYARAFSNTVTLPNGELLVVGGNTVARVFSDQGSVLPAEIYSPATDSWRVVDSISVPRNYHSIALLLKDGRVLSAGGGGCGNCSTNHLDGQIYSPPYLFNADGSAATRPEITFAPGQAEAGDTITVTASPDTRQFSMVRLSGTTHHINTDQRFLPVPTVDNGDGTFDLTLNANPNVLIPGNYWLYALNADGTPSIGETVQIVREDAPDTGIVTTGSANVVNAATGEIQITPAANVQLGGATIQPVSLSEDFIISADLNFGTKDGNGADGMALTLHADPRGAQALSTITGPGLGAWGIQNGLAFEFDTYQNGGVIADPAQDHFAAWDTDTGVPTAAGNPGANGMTQVLSPVVLGNIEDGQWRSLRMTWDVSAQRLTVSLDGVTLGTLDADIADLYFGGAASVYASVTGATGGLNNDQRVRGFASQAQPDVDSDGDGVPDGDDAFPNDPSETTDSDGDGVGDNGDAFPNDPTETQDTDGDGIGDNADPYPLDPDNTPQAAEPIHYWPMDGNDDVVVLDTAGSANGTIVGAGRTAGRIAGGLRFDEASEHVALNIANLPAPWTASMWVKRNGASINATLLVSGEVSIKLEQWRDTRQVGFTRYGVRDYLFGYEAAVGTWTHLTFVNDGSEMRLYANCSLVGTNANTIDLPLTLFGNRTTGVSNLNADLDELKIFDQALAGQDLDDLCDIPAIPNDDRDGDGVPDDEDAFPDDPTESSDSDGDGVGENADVFPNDPSETADSDGDGVGNNADVFPNDPTETADTDGDGVGDNADPFPNDPDRDGRIAPLPEYPRQSTTLIVVDHDGAERVWNVNPDNASVSVSASDGFPVAEIAVGEGPWALARSTASDRVYVTNKESHSLSIISLDTLQVVDTVPLAENSQPHGIVFDGAGDYYYVVLEALARVEQRSATDDTLVRSLDLPGTPRHLSMTYDDTRLLISNFITPPIPGEHTAAPQVESGFAELFVLEPASLTMVNTVDVPFDTTPRSESRGPGLPNYLAAATVSFDSTRAFVPGKKDNIQAGGLRGSFDLSFDQAVRAHTSRVDLGSGTATQGIDHDNSSVATGAAFSGDSRYLLITLETSRELVIYDTLLGFELMRLDTGRAPQSVAFSKDSTIAYVHNFMDRSISLFDLSEAFATELPVRTVIGEFVVVNDEALGADVLQGKQLFYDAADDRLARDRYMSCAACHNDAKHDGRTWDFTQFGEGLRNTPSLLGKAGLGQGLLHWTGNFDEVQDFEGQIRGFAGGTGLMSDADFNTGTRAEPLGDAKAGLSDDLDALAAYLTSLSDGEVNPHAAVPLEEQGAQLFEQHDCASCHSGEQSTDSATGARHDVGTIDTDSGLRLGTFLDGFDTPTLLGLWASAPYLHDGSAATLEEAILAHGDVAINQSDAQALAAYVARLSTVATPIGPIENVAPGKSARQSSTGWGGLPARGVDGNNDGRWSQRSVTHTNQENSPWWEVDLATVHYVESVRLWNRTDCCTQRLANFYVLTSETPFTSNSLTTLLNQPGVTAVYHSGVAGRETLFDVAKNARYVRIQIAGTGILSLAEVDIMGAPLDPGAVPPPVVNVAPGKTVGQSSTGWGGLPARGVDGNNDGRWSQRSVTHTNQENSPWWEVDLATVHYVESVRLWNRTDCCTRRLANFYVLTSETPFTSNSLTTLLNQPGVTAVYHSGVAGRETLFDVAKDARYVRIQIAGTGILSLAEVEVMGYSR